MYDVTLLYLSFALPFFTIYSIGILIKHLNDAGANPKGVNKLVINFIIPAMRCGLLLMSVFAGIASQINNKILAIMIVSPITSFLYSAVFLNLAIRLYKDERRLHNLFKHEYEEIDLVLIDFDGIKSQLKGMINVYIAEMIFSVGLLGYMIYSLYE